MISHFFRAGHEIYRDDSTGEEASKPESQANAPAAWRDATAEARYDALERRYYEQLDAAGIGEALYEQIDDDDFDRIGER